MVWTQGDRDWRLDSMCCSHLHSQSKLYDVSWSYLILVIDLIGQFSRNVIGRLSVKAWRPWRLVMSLVRFASSIVTV